MTTSAVVCTFLFIHIGVILVVTAYFALSAALAPRMAERARIRFGRRPWLPVLVGLVVSVPWVVLALVLLNLDPAGLKFGGAVLGGLWVLGGLVGGAGIAQHVGGSGGTPGWTGAVRGGILISLTWVLPLVGWLVMLPLTLAAGIGCLVLGVLPVREDRPLVPAVPVSA
jgi:hypothetical protein